ncbi:uncharacterized protein LOC143604191 [Bidens hawaiensis]|uniref:uncharacterized protein LOC143604191 n=1 Tax=Bidens hawaiensis TaxID=980011 RepID=UPI0040496729
MDEEIEMVVPGKVQNTTPVAPPLVKKPVEVQPSPVIDHSRILFPACAKHQKYTREYGHFLDMFQQLKINLPFIEALQHMLKYAKFLKDLLKRKDRLGELELGELTSTRMSLSLADHWVKYPRGIIENLLVKVDKFVFPVDFVVLDMEADEKVPIILGRPFLRNAKAIIDVSMKHPSDQDDSSGPCHSVCFINSFIAGIDSCFDYICGADLVGSNGLVDCDDVGEDASCENDSVCDELDEISGLPEMIEVNEISCESEAGSEEKPAPLELKVLPSNLEYAYLDEDSNLPVIMSSKLKEEQKTKLIDVLKLHERAIAWRLSDIHVLVPLIARTGF